MPRARRIDRPDDCPFTRGGEVQIQFEGRPVTGFEHEPLAMALLAAGIRVFGRSIKYHRPRGPTCLQAHCSGCLMRVDGVPNVRTCDLPCHSGLVVERQIGWPGSGRDLLRITDWLFGRHLDQHGMFTASGTVNRLAMRLVRRMAGFGQAPSADPPPPNPIEPLSAEVVVIGAGVAGLQASMALAEAGHPVLLLEQGDKIGGRLLDRSCRLATDGGPARSGWQARQEIRTRFEKLRDIELHQAMPVVAVYRQGDGFRVVAANEAETLDIAARRLVVCVGAWGQVPLFENNDLPGIFTMRGFDRMVFGWGVVPAEPVLLAGQSEALLRLALELQQAGVSVAGVVTDRSEGDLVAQLGQRGVALYPGADLLRARGGRWLDRVELSRPGPGGADLVLDCAALAVEAPEAPAYELAHHAGCKVEFDSASGYRVATDSSGRTSDVHVFAAGHCAGARDVEASWQQGLRAGLACALTLGDEPALRQRLADLAGPAGADGGSEE